jgi:excisionase family DNA binding protein
MAQTTSENTASVFKSVDELATEINLSRAKTYEGLRSGAIPSIRVGKRFILPRQAIRRWLDGCYPANSAQKAA